MASINPSIQTMKYGKKESKELQIYPLSLGDEAKMTTAIADFFIKIRKSASDGVTDFNYIPIFMESVKENIDVVVKLACCFENGEEVEVVNNMTNAQFVEFCNIVWETSFEEAVKNGQNLVNKVKKVLPLTRLQQGSSETTPNTPSTTSSTEASKEEELQAVKSLSSTSSQ